MTDGSHIGKLEAEMKQLATLKRKKVLFFYIRKKRQKNIKKSGTSNGQTITSASHHSHLYVYTFSFSL